MPCVVSSLPGTMRALTRMAPNVIASGEQRSKSDLPVMSIRIPWSLSGSLH